jgi:hypothetical protein
LVDELEWVPENLAIKGDARACDCDPHEAGQREANGDDYELDILAKK